MGLLKKSPPKCSRIFPQKGEILFFVNQHSNLSWYFDPRPLRGATASLPSFWSPLRISTHTPLAGRDLRPRRCAFLQRDFNSHAPCGARPEWAGVCFKTGSFQLTRPLRGATYGKRCVFTGALISTHTPLAGRDLSLPSISCRNKEASALPVASCASRTAMRSRIAAYSSVSV